MGKKIKLIPDARFGLLIVVKELSSQKGHALYECICDCGKVYIARASAAEGKSPRVIYEAIKKGYIRYGFKWAYDDKN